MPFTTQEDSNVSPLLLLTPMMCLRGLKHFKMLVMSLEGMLLSENDFCTNTNSLLVLGCFPFPNICQWRGPEGAVERRWVLGS